MLTVAVSAGDWTMPDSTEDIRVHKNNGRNSEFREGQRKGRPNAVIEIANWADADVPTYCNLIVDANPNQISFPNDSTTRIGNNNYYGLVYNKSESLYEWEIHFEIKPPIHEFVFDIEYENLNFNWQDTLTTEEIDSGKFRPDSVIYSYSVKHASKINGEYRLGKAFHLYRPKAWDSVGDTIWIEQIVDTVANTYKLTIDNTWLDNAVYPVTIDPTIGNDGIGASTNANISVTARQYGRMVVASEAGTIDSVYVYVDEDAATSTVRYITYRDDSEQGCGAYVDTNTTATTYTSSAFIDEWAGFELADSVTLAADDTLWLYPFLTAGACSYKYDSGQTGTYFEGSWQPSWYPDPCAPPSWSGSTDDYSIYLLYSPSGEAVKPYFPGVKP